LIAIEKKLKCVQLFKKKSPGFVHYKTGCTRLAAACDKVYQLLAHGWWFSPGTLASSTTKSGRHDITVWTKLGQNGIKDVASRVFTKMLQKD
jgi:hypothetical protein